MNPFTRKVLIQDISSEMINHTIETLKKHGIRYELFTRQNHRERWRRKSPVARNFGSLTPEYSGIWNDSPVTDKDMGTVSEYVYVIYVNRKDLDRARKICSIQ